MDEAPSEASPAVQSEAADPPTSRRFRSWRAIVVVTLMAGYMGYYFNRSNLSVSATAIKDEFSLSESQYGIITSVGYGVYAAGKFMNGFAVDYFGGRPMFLVGLGGSAVFTVLFTFCKGVPGFSTMWALSRFLQSVGWGALVKVTARWFASGDYGKIMGIMSLSYLLGDALIRLVFGFILSAGLSWRQLFYISAGIAWAILLPSLYTLVATPAVIGEPEPRASEKSVFADKGDVDKPSEGFWQLLRPLLLLPKFWILLIESFVLTIVRELFNSWLPYYLEVELKLSPGDASYASTVFPFFGTLSAILGGYLVDQVAPRWRGGIALVFLIGLAGTQLGLWAFSSYYNVIDDGNGGTDGTALTIALVLVSITGFVLLAPYSFVDGVFALEISGKRAAAVTVSFINGMGYVGTIASGYVTGVLVENYDWYAVFLLTSALSVVTMVAAVVFWMLDVRDIAALEREDAARLLEPEGKALRAL